MRCAALILVAILSALCLPQAGWADEAVIPQRFAGFDSGLPEAAKSPPGRAIALYHQSVHEDDDGQCVLLGADGRTYRKISEVDGWCGGAVLADDGTAVVIGRTDANVAALQVMDLSTGTITSYPTGVEAAITVHTWSPNKRYVVYSTWLRRSNAAQADPIAADYMTRLLDRETGRTTALPQKAVAASFAPDSVRFALETGKALEIVGLDGKKQRIVTRSRLQRLHRGKAWSPDGELLITRAVGSAEAVTEGVSGDRYPDISQRDEFVDATGRATAVPGPLPEGSSMADWRGPRSILSMVYVDDDVYLDRILEQSVETGAKTTLARFRDLTHPIQFASALLRAAQVQPIVETSRAATKRRSGGVVWIGAFLVACLVAATGTGGFWWWRREHQASALPGM